MTMSMLQPMFGMIAMSAIVTLLLYASRFVLIYRVRAAGVDLAQARYADEARQRLPGVFRNITDNYNHLLEQPTLFYATVIYIHLMEHSDGLHLWLAWAYVAIRAVHSGVQISVNHVPWRIASFVASGGCLLVMIAREAVALL